MKTHQNETYKQIAAIVNSLSKEKYSYSELYSELFLKKCKYITYTCSYLSKEFGNDAPAGTKKTIIIPSYPIYYLKFKTYITEQRERLENKSPESITYKRPESISYKRPESISISIETKESNFSIFLDSELVAELRKRGYEVSAKKVIEL